MGKIQWRNTVHTKQQTGNIKKNYSEFEKTITETLQNTIAKQKIRTEKPHKHKNDEIKQAKIKRKTARKDFREACIRANKEEIQKTKTRYIEKHSIERCKNEMKKTNKEKKSRTKNSKT